MCMKEKWEGKMCVLSGNEENERNIKEQENNVNWIRKWRKAYGNGGCRGCLREFEVKQICEIWEKVMRGEGSMGRTVLL